MNYTGSPGASKPGKPQTIQVQGLTARRVASAKLPTTSSSQGPRTKRSPDLAEPIPKGTSERTVLAGAEAVYLCRLEGLRLVGSLRVSSDA